jgi:hypothetical protein
MQPCANDYELAIRYCLTASITSRKASEIKTSKQRNTPLQLQLPLLDDGCWWEALRVIGVVKPLTFW